MRRRRSDPSAAPARRRLKAQVRATPDQGEGTFHALVSAYGVEYSVGWGWTEEILPGAFADSIAAQPAIPAMYEHDWRSGPIGVSERLEETEDGLEAFGRLYLGMSDRIDVIYQAMKDEALREWSIAFWPEEIVNTKDEPYKDSIQKGDLAEVTVCIRGANPDTETLDVRSSQPGWIDGDARQEVVRMRRQFAVPDLGKLKGRATEPDTEPDAGELAQALDAVIDEIVEALESDDAQGALDLARAADATSDDLLTELGVADDDDLEDEDEEGGAKDEASAERARRLMATSGGRELLSRLRSSAPAPSSA